MENKKLEKGYLINFGFAILMMMAMTFFICNSFIFAPEFSKLGRYLTKGIASLLFVFFGIFNFNFAKKSEEVKNKKFMLFMIIGLVFAMLGDMFLIDFFIVGAGLFAVGHVFYFVAFCFVSKFKFRDLICMVAIFVPAILVILLYPHFVFDGMLPVVIAYALIISAMLGKAISNAFEKGNKVLNWVVLIGALMFFLSDLMLLFNVFASAPFVFDVACIALYYPAEFVLAFSILFAGFKYEKQSKAE